MLYLISRAGMAIRYTPPPPKSTGNMWFKNLTVFRFEEIPELDPSTLEEALEAHRFSPCDPQQMESLGWVAPMGEQSEQLVHAGSGMMLLTARREQRLLPVTVIREALDRKVKDIEAEEDRKLGRRRKMEIRDQLTFEMMPKAFTRSGLIQGLILPAEQAIVVDVSSRKRAEEWISLLRDSLGSLPVAPPAFTHALPDIYTGWVSGNGKIPQGVQPGDECVLASPDREGAVVRCRRVDLSGGDVSTHIDAGMQVTRLSLEWQERLSMVLNEDGDIRRLQFSDTVVEQMEADGVNDEAAEFDARFNLMGLEISRLLPALWKALGGLDN